MDPSAINDPFAALDDQRTFIKPTPGGRTSITRPLSDAGTQPDAAAPDLSAPDQGLNPLVALANRLLLVVPQLRTTRHVDDPAALRNSLAQGIRDFAARATQQGIAPERVMAARYVLCTMLDEAAADTPWGGSGVWARHSLLAMFHNEVEGGEKVFQLMARLAEKPDVNRDLLELIYCALTLGFEGRYRVIDNGRAQLEAVRDKLAQILKQQRGDHPHALAQHWQGQPVGRHVAHSWLPLAAAAGVAALLLMAVYLGLSSSLGGRSDPVFGQIQSLRLTPPVVSTPLPAPKPRLAQFLQSDIKAGLVAVRDEIDRSVVTIRGDGAFATGSATLLPDREVLMGRIADALAQVSGNIVVTGHTDSQPIARSARFPSNWHLSEARAATVRDLLVSRKVAAERIRAEGRADAEPVVANDTAGNRAMNRRVEVTLFVGRSAENKAAGK
ncbi:MAG TPA: DotU family type VI secretion system protein [Albitalea sp.]|uniref:DotU family type VI secretion system protein n=1 Tax=Piscinibacter sp. TaxID=1903157 RepID=UPI002ED64F87